MHKVKTRREGAAETPSIQNLSADDPTVEILAEEDETSALKNSDRSYCGSYTALENAIYQFVDIQYALNIYDDKAMDEFFAGM